MVLFKCARKYPILSHKIHTHAFTTQNSYTHARKIHTTNIRCSHSATQRTSPTSSAFNHLVALFARSFAFTHKLSNWMCFSLLNLPTSNLASQQPLPLPLSHFLFAAVYARNIILFCVGCSGIHSLLMAEHNMPIESIIAVDFLMIATIVLFLYGCANGWRKSPRVVHLLNQKFVRFIRK